MFSTALSILEKHLSRDFCRVAVRVLKHICTLNRFQGLRAVCQGSLDFHTLAMPFKAFFNINILL